MLRSPVYVATLNAFTAEAIAIVALMTLKLHWVPGIVVVVEALIGVALVFAPLCASRARAKALGMQIAGREH